MAQKKILIVDDEKDILAVLEKRLSIAGYSVIKADNGKDAVALAKTERPNLIVLDIMMPDMDGAAVAEVLKEDADTTNIPIMFLTCLLTKEEEVEKGHKIKDNFFLAKPFNPDELLKEIKKQISGDV